jgi:hypothetical protein
MPLRDFEMKSRDTVTFRNTIGPPMGSDELLMDRLSSGIRARRSGSPVEFRPLLMTR